MEADLFADLDIDALLASFSGETAAALSEVLAPSPPPPPARDAEAGSPESVTSRASPPGEEVVLSEIERFLMEEGDAEAAEGISVEEFFDVLYDGGEGEGQEKQGKESEAAGSADGDSAREEEVGVEVVTPEADEEVVGDDPISKKKRRQMRNRDSAMKSRERKKSYVKDLETKSKYLEAECRRLSYALQCYAAENMALRQSVMKDRLVGAPTAKQESAVLMGTLPLVSLLWLVSIVCLFLMRGLPDRSPGAPRSPGRDLVMVAGKTASSEKPETALELILHGRRCKGTRAKIKQLDTPFHAAAAC